MNTRYQHLLPALVATLLLLLPLTGCQKSRPDMRPDGISYAITAQLSDTLSLGINGTLDLDSVTITGLGMFRGGATDKLTITPKEGYYCDGLYFGRTPLYDRKQFPTTEEDALKVSEITIEVKGDLTIKPIIRRVEGPIEQPTYAKNVLLDEAYWREENRKAWDEIYPKIVREPEEDYLTGFVAQHLIECHPDMSTTLRTDTIYRGEGTLFASIIVPERQPRDGDHPEIVPYSEGYRVAYALADRSGQIKEIYTPHYWDGRCVTQQRGNALGVPTVPEGEYILKTLINFPEERDKWYDIPLMDYCHFLWFDNNVIKHPNRPDYDTHNFTEWGVVCGDPLSRERLFFSDKIWRVQVVERNSADTPPIPRWYKPRVYNSPVQSEENRCYRGPFMNIDQNHSQAKKSAKIRLANGCNQTLRGKIIATLDYHHWFDQNLDIIEQYERNLKENWYSSVGNMPLGVNILEWTITIGEKEVTIPGNSTSMDISIVYKSPLRVRDSWGWLDMMPPKGVVFYWQPEGSDKCFLMQQSYHDIMQLIEKEERLGLPYSRVWIGGLLGATEPILGTIVNKYMPEWDSTIPQLQGYASEWVSSCCNFIPYYM